MNRASARRCTRIVARELERAMRSMRIPGYPPPFFVSCLLRDEESWRVQAKYGAIIRNNHERRRNALVDVRVGSYRSDQIREGGLGDNDKEAESYNYVDLPFGSGGDGLRHGLWRLIEARYREAIESLLLKRSQALTYVDASRHLPAFERRAPVVDLHWTPLPPVDQEFWIGCVERMSRRIRRFTQIQDAHVEFEANHSCRSFVSSEGTRRMQCQATWSLECYLWMQTGDGHSFPWTLKHTVTDPAELPDEPTFARQIRQAVRKLGYLAAASQIHSFCGPALLEPGPGGLLIHEALGHRVEGNRLLCPGEGQTFKGSLSSRVLPSFLSVYDDPTVKRYDGRSLVGHYLFDDEGVDAQRADLVREGRLSGFLTSRTCIGRRHRSNGHARSQYNERAISRMGVLIVEPRDGLGSRELKRVLLEEIRRRKVPFGVRIVDATSGETATDAYNFQAFLGEINLAAKVYPDGREEWIRGANFVGTPLNGIHSIIAAGREMHVDNAYCGAESGYVPVSTISPALVLSELELQSKPESRYTPFSLPIPWLGRRRRPPKRGGRR